MTDAIFRSCLFVSEFQNIRYERNTYKDVAPFYIVFHTMFKKSIFRDVSGAYSTKLIVYNQAVPLLWVKILVLC